MIINSEKTLRFKDKETFENFVREINRKDEKEKLLFSLQKGIQSPLAIMIAADEELDVILNTSADLEDFKTKYTLFKEKYSSDFLFKEQSQAASAIYINCL